VRQNTNTKQRISISHFLHFLHTPLHSSKQIKQLESDLAASTQSIKSIVAREARQNTKFSYDERTKKILLREAEELSSARVKESFPSMPDRGSLLEGEVSKRLEYLFFAFLEFSHCACT